MFRFRSSGKRYSTCQQRNGLLLLSTGTGACIARNWVGAKTLAPCVSLLHAVKVIVEETLEEYGRWKDEKRQEHAVMSTLAWWFCSCLVVFWGPVLDLTFKLILRVKLDENRGRLAEYWQGAFPLIIIFRRFKCTCTRTCWWDWK